MCRKNWFELFQLKSFFCLDSSKIQNFKFQSSMLQTIIEYKKVLLSIQMSYHFVVVKLSSELKYIECFASNEAIAYSIVQENLYLDTYGNLSLFDLSKSERISLFTNDVITAYSALITFVYLKV